jgi:hypothetical protein
MVEMNDGHANNWLINFVEALVVLINHFLHEQRFPFQFFVEVGYEYIGVIRGASVLRRQSVGFNSHVEFLEEIVRDMVVGIVFEIGLV